MLYLSPYTGTGTIQNPFMPRGMELLTPGVSSIDLRPDPTAQAGLGLIWSPVALSDPQIHLLAVDKLDTIPVPVRNNIENRLGITLTGGTTAWEVLADLLFNDRQIWKIPTASQGKKTKEIWLGGQKWAEQIDLTAPDPVYLDPTDDFARADNTDIGANWSVINTMDNLQIVSQVVRATGASSHAAEYWNADTPSNDQNSSVQIVTVPTGTNDTVAAAVRCATGANSMYYNQSRTNKSALWKLVSGSYTQLNSNATNPATNTVVKIEAEGSTIRLYYDDTIESDLTSTDTALTSGYWGISIYHESTDASAELDNWTGANVGAGVSIPIVMHHRKIQGIS